MPIEKTSQIYEVLWRFENGALTGAHTRQIETVADTETGEVYSARETPAAPLALADVSAYMDDALAGAAVQVTALTAERDGLAAQVAALTAERDALAAQLSPVQAG